MTATRSRPPLKTLVAVAGALALCACSPSGPPGVDRDELDAQVSKAIGDPASCLLIAKAGSGRVLYRYNSATACDRELPNCTAEGQPQGKMKVKALLEAAAKDGQPRTLSCSSTADASRGVGWAAGPIKGTDMVYAAMMEGERSFPGRMMAERLEAAFRRAKVSKAAP
ncbi:MAG TPA: hypothetical protein VGR74_24120 [Actinomycetota bacterium]|nr:hypothetical protein [Actinomycetota bacterium]